MGRTKPAELVDGERARKAVQAVTNTVGVFLKTAGFKVDERAERYDTGFTRRLVVASQDAEVDDDVWSQAAVVRIDSVRGPGYGLGSFIHTKVMYRPAARVTVEVGMGQKAVWAQFDDDGASVRPCAGDGFDRIHQAVKTAIANAERGNAFRRRQDEAFRTVKAAVQASPIHRDILADGLDVRADVIGGKGDISIDCRPEDFAEIWKAVRSVLHRLSNRCECGDALPLGQATCSACAQGIAKRPLDPDHSALRVLPRHKLDFGERPDLSGVLEG